MSNSLISPYGGNLVNLMVPQDDFSIVRERANHLPSVQISDRAVCDLELLATGGFSPLDRFMGKEDYERVLDEMRLKSGHIFPIPITLPVDPSPDIKEGASIALRDSKNTLLAVMQIDEIYEWELEEVAQKAFGTKDDQHPIVAEMHRWGKLNITGELTVVQLPSHPDFASLRLTPSETRTQLQSLDVANVVAFQTRNPLHRVHEELTVRAADTVNGALLIHPVVGMTKPGDVDHITRVRTYRALTDNYYENTKVTLSLLPLAMRMGGPREALWHALIRRNYGANHLIVGRDHAGPGNDSKGKPFYGPYDAQDMVEAYSEELGVGVVPFKEFVYLPKDDKYEEVSKVPHGTETASISGTQVRSEYLIPGRPLPQWFTRPEVADILAESYPPRDQQGICIWFTGLSGAGKSTTAEAVIAKIMEHGRAVTELDGDVVRTHLSKGLGFSKEDRDTNILRIGFVAAEITRHGGIAVCAAVSPYRATRNDVRNLVGDNFVEVFVDTPLEVCEERDAKGMYAKARRGEIKGFTGIDDPYEEPENAEIVLDTVTKTADANAETVLEYLYSQGFLVAGKAVAV